MIPVQRFFYDHGSCIPEGAPGGHKLGLGRPGGPSASVRYDRVLLRRKLLPRLYAPYGELQTWLRFEGLFRLSPALKRGCAGSDTPKLDGLQGLHPVAFALIRLSKNPETKTILHLSLPKPLQDLELCMIQYGGHPFLTCFAAAQHTESAAYQRLFAVPSQACLQRQQEVSPTAAELAFEVLPSSRGRESRTYVSQTRIGRSALHWYRNPKEVRAVFYCLGPAAQQIQFTTYSWPSARC